MLLPSPAITGARLPPPPIGVSVSWVMPPVSSQAKISLVRSLLAPVRSRLDLKAMRLPSAARDTPSLDPPVVAVICVVVGPALRHRKTSWLASALPPPRLAVDRKAIWVPSDEIDGPSLLPLAVAVTGVVVGPVLVHRKTSLLASLLAPPMSRFERNATLVPSAEMVGLPLMPPDVVVTWVVTAPAMAHT